MKNQNLDIKTIKAINEIIKNAPEKLLGANEKKKCNTLLNALYDPANVRGVIMKLTLKDFKRKDLEKDNKLFNNNLVIKTDTGDMFAIFPIEAFGKRNYTLMKIYNIKDNIYKCYIPYIKEYHYKLDDVNKSYNIVAILYGTAENGINTIREFELKELI